MNPYITFLALYFLVTGSLELFFSGRANSFYEKCIQVKNFRIFSLWAFSVGLVAYLGMPVQHFKWFVLILIWLYGVMGFWLLFSPVSFLQICKKTYFNLNLDARRKMIKFDGVTRFLVAFLLWNAAQ